MENKYWNKLNKIQPHSFWIINNGVSRVPDSCGNWLERDKVQQLIESADLEICELRSALQAMLTYFDMDEDEWSKPVFENVRYVLNGK